MIHEGGIVLKQPDIKDVYGGGRDAPVHGLGLDVSEPDPQIWSEVLTRELQHGDVAAAV